MSDHIESPIEHDCLNTDALTPDEIRNAAIGELDTIRRQEQLVASSKAHYLLLAADHGVGIADIAEVVGMSASGVRDAIRRAKASPPFLGAGEAAGSLPEVP